MSLHHNQRKLAKGLSELFDLPQDIMLDLPRITVLGNQKLLIENHKGIIEYGSEKLRIRVTQGEVSIDGHGFSLSHIQADQILIEGVIVALHFE